MVKWANCLLALLEWCREAEAGPTLWSNIINDVCKTVYYQKKPDIAPTTTRRKTKSSYPESHLVLFAGSHSSSVGVQPHLPSSQAAFFTCSLWFYPTSLLFPADQKGALHTVCSCYIERSCRIVHSNWNTCPFTWIPRLDCTTLWQLFMSKKVESILTNTIVFSQYVLLYGENSGKGFFEMYLATCFG